MSGTSEAQPGDQKTLVEISEELEHPVISNWNRDELPGWKQRCVTALRPVRPTDVV